MIRLGLEGGFGLVLGAASGIGRAVSLSLARHGVSLATIDRLSIDGLTSQLTEEGLAEPYHVTADVTEDGSLDEALDKILSRNGPISYVVSAVGAHWHEHHANFSRDNVRRTMETNLFPNFVLGREVGHHFASLGIRGSLVLIGSTIVQHPNIGESAYMSSKAALAALGSTLAVEYAEFGARVNVVAPGVTRTPLFEAGASPELERRLELDIPLGRLCEPKDVADAVLFLLSNETAGNITGTTLVVDGGLSLRPLRFTGV